MKTIRSIAIVLAFGVPTAMAGDWEHSVTPYVWAAGQEGESGERDTPAGDLIAEYDMSASDIFERLNGAFLVAYRAEKAGTWGLIFDLVYMNVEDDGEIGPLDINVENPQLLITTAYTRAFRAESSWWWYAGVRYVELETEIRFEGNGPAGIDGNHTVDGSWVDPFVGLNYRRELSPRWSLGVTADVGGFGIGSEAAYQAMAEGGFRISDLLRLRFGYRWMDTDYDNNGFVFDATSQGAIIGLAFHW